MNKPIAIIPKNKKETLNISLDEFNGHDLFSARVWFQADDGMRPSKSGLAFRVALLPEFAKAVNEAISEAERRGLLPPQSRPRREGWGE
ncbi:MAG TPA: transcriptional coactivator p15/PC4 family protein [Mesorhizobium sp.]|jgi:hypothetical protein|nr:transcriptional coactivator p15/PC4 family protein [Mesorhizobium sp.]